MYFPEYLYRLTPRDEQVTPLEFVTQRLTNTVSNTTTVSSSAYTVPLGKLFLLQSSVMRFSCDAIASIGLYALTAFIDPTTTAPGVSYDNANLDGATNGHTNDGTTIRWRFGGAYPDILVPEGWQIYAQSTNDALAGSLATVDLQISGILIPRGNFAI